MAPSSMTCFPCPPLLPLPPPPLNAESYPLPVVVDTDLTTVIDLSKARDIAPHKLDKSLWHLQDTNRILKRGLHVKVAEAEALRYLACSTQVPVPEVYGAYEKDGYGHIFMARVDGKPLQDVLNTLSELQMEKVIEQLAGFVKSWSSLHGDYFGSLGFKPCRDVFFQHLPAIGMPDQEYGPYKSREEYCSGLIEALRNSRPGGVLDENDAPLISKIRNLGSEPAVFCHGDLHPNNILVDDQANVVAIIDTGVSGFSIPEREYFEAKSRADDTKWSAMIDRIIPSISPDTYLLLDSLEGELVYYSGI